MRYLWQNNVSPIQEIMINAGRNTATEAIIFAPSLIEENSALASLDVLLASKGLTVSYDTLDNRPVLRVGGFTQDNELLSLLQEAKLVEGAPQAQKTPDEKPKFDRLTAAAAFYMLGNVTGLMGGWVRKDNAELASNAAFTIGDASLLLFGRKTAAEKQHSVMRGFGQILKQNGVEVEGGSAFNASAIAHPPGVWGSIRRFMADKVIAIKSISEITAGIKKVQAGINQQSFYKKMAGTFIASGFLAGWMIPEKSKAELREELGATSPEDLKAKLAALPLGKRIITTVQAQPLIIPGSFAGFNNIANLTAAHDEYSFYKKEGISRKEEKLTAQLNGGVYHTSIFGKVYESKPQPGAINERDKAKAAFEAMQGVADDNPDKLKALEAYNKAAKEVEDLQKELVVAKEGRYPKQLNPKHFWKFDLVQTIFFAIANILYASSPKGGNPADNKKLRDSFFAAVTSEIAKAPASQKDYLFGVACHYAGNSKELGVTAKEAQEIIARKIQMLEANPWLRQHAQKEAAGVPPELLEKSVEERLDVPAVETSKHSQNIAPREKPKSLSLANGWSTSLSEAAPQAFSNGIS